MRCENCGTETNFDGAAICPTCNKPLHPESKAATAQEPNSLDSVESTTKVGFPQSSQTDDPDKIEIGVADPMDFVMGVENPDAVSFQAPSNEPLKPEPIEDELTLYRDQDVKLSLSESGPKPTVTLESLKDKLKITAQTDQPAASPEDVSVQTNADLISDSQPPVEEESVSLTSAQGQNHAAYHSTRVEAVKEQPPKAAANEPVETRKAASIAAVPTLSELKQSKGVIHLSSHGLKLAGGAKVNVGDEVIINERAYEVKRSPGRGPMFYAGIGIAAAVVFLAVLIIVNLTSRGTGQVAGIVVGNIDGRPIPGLTVRISELNKTATTNQAGFFVFDQLPTGIYTVEYQATDGTRMEDKITIVENQTTAVALKDALPQVYQSIQRAEPTRPAPQQARSEPSKTGKGILKITLEPNNASVFIDDSPVGIGSNSYKLSAGSYSLTVKKSGYAEESRIVKIESDKTTSLKVTLSEDKTSQPKSKSYGEIAHENEIAGNYREAIRNYDKVLERNPRDISAILGKARCYRAQGLVDNALAAFSQAAKLASYKGDSQSQIEALSGIAEIKPNTFSAYSARGDILYELGQYERAINDFSKVIELDNRNLSAYYKLGNCFYNIKNYREALNTFHAAQDLNFADPKAEAYLAKTYLALGDKRNCKKSYEKFKDMASYSTRLEFKKDPDWQKVLTALGVVE